MDLLYSYSAVLALSELWLAQYTNLWSDHEQVNYEERKKNLKKNEIQPINYILLIEEEMYPYMKISQYIQAIYYCWISKILYTNELYQCYIR